MYRNSKKYRYIWEKAYGPIPTDKEGRPFEIHHKDGNKHNNDLSNLECVSIEEHYRIHLLQGDQEACHAISLRMKKGYLTGWHHTEETLEKLRKPKKNKVNYKKTEEHKRKLSKAKKGIKLPARSEAFKNNLRKPKSEEFKKRVSATMTGVSKAKIQCPFCKKEGGANVMRRWHFNNCKQK